MIIQTAEQMEEFGQSLGAKLRGGAVIELIGDIGAGKTTLTRGIARGLGITDNMTSPSFTISCNYNARDDLQLCHYDFYRLDDAGIMTMELSETTADPHNIVIIEWADSVRDVLPTEHITIQINYQPNSGREVEIIAPSRYAYLLPEHRLSIN